MKKLTLTIIAFMIVAFMGPALVPTSTVSAACDETGSKSEVLKGLNATGNDCEGGGVLRFAKGIVNIISIIAGIIAVIMILISGVKYMTSSGDTGKIASAKTTLIYALIGLVIVALAQVLVNFALSTAQKAKTSSLPTSANSLSVYEINDSQSEIGA